MTTPIAAPGVLRGHEWTCICPNGSSIRAESCSRCPRCGVSRPDTAAIAHAVERTRRILDAMECFDRMAGKLGRFQAMEYVLSQFGGER